MRNYETLFILKATDDEEVKANIEKFKGIIESNGGVIDNVDEWGRRKLAYPINKVNEGYYTLINFQAESDLPRELERNFKITDSVMRYVVVNPEK